MTLAVIDTNILVSAFWSRNGTPAKILALVQAGRLKPCFDSRILSEYREVLLRPRFGFSTDEVETVLHLLKDKGLDVLPSPLHVVFPDESDRMFYEVAKYCGAKLITGNQKHFPQDPDVVTAAEFMEMCSLAGGS